MPRSPTFPTVSLDLNMFNFRVHGFKEAKGLKLDELNNGHQEWLYVEHRTSYPTRFMKVGKVSVFGTHKPGWPDTQIIHDKTYDVHLKKKDL